MMAEPAYQFAQGLPRKALPPLNLERERPYPSASAAVTTSTTYAHSRSRTTSSSIFPLGPPPAAAPSMYSSTFAAKRTPSNATYSTAGSSNSPRLARPPSTDLRRSTSSRSGGGQPPSSYVASMRRQKATVWCERAQHEDPRLVAAQRAAKMRAHMEVVGATQGGRTSTAGSGSMVGSNRVTAKIRHHGKSSLVGYQPAGHLGLGMGGVPMRLSATEVEGGDSDDDAESGNGLAHYHRSGSGRSSVSSARRGLTYARQSGISNASGRWSAGHTPPSEAEGALVQALQGLTAETPVPPRKSYVPPDGSTHRTGSVSSGERADGLGDLGGDAARLASNSLLKSTITREKSTKNADELRRRGSVDDRTMTLSAGRLFVANPDLDSD